MEAPLLLKDEANNRWGVFYRNTGQWVRSERYARWLHKRKMKRHQKYKANLTYDDRYSG